MILTALSACAHSGKGRRLANEDLVSADAPVATFPVGDRTRAGNLIAPGYQLQLASPEDKTLNGKYRIEFDGEIKLPYDVVLNIGGLTLGAARERILEAYKPFFKSKPAIKVTLVERMAWVQVNGLVEKPGRVLVKENATLDEVIGAAGGLQRPSGNDAKASPIARFVRIEQTNSSPLSIKLADYYSGAARALIPRWLGGDLVFLQSDGDSSMESAQFDSGDVQVLGEVKSAGEYRFRTGADFFYYLGKAGGPTAQSKLSKIEVIRGLDSRRQSMTFDLADTDAVPVLRAGDQVIVHAEKAPSQFIATLLAIVSTIFLGIVAF